MKDMENKKILAVIPARSGSKTIIDKNIRKINGKPMLAYSIEHAKQSKLVTRTIISTDSEKYAKIAADYGCEVPFLRPMELAADDSLDLEVFTHALCYLKEKEGYVPDIVVQLRPTYPMRNATDIDNMITLLDEHPEADSVRCIAPAKEIPHKMWKEKDGIITPLLTDIEEAYNMPRQKLPLIHYQNACIDVFRGDTVLKKRSMTGDIILGYKMNHNYDIDTEEDFQKAELVMRLQNCTNRTFVFDIDGVIAQFNESLQYDESLPNKRMIEIVNGLYDRGNKIVLFTARGYKTGLDWRSTTEKQMSEWGVKYHELKFGKPDADFYVDDKILSIDDIFKYLI